jgi:transposase
VQSKLLDLENSLRGILRGFGLKVGKTTRTSFAGDDADQLDPSR